ncbi:hypothetical protein KY363_05205 [Candidatus Woesearchaeota archaeon]|nr:hypothetical protein [Candidatus Woesearchaeota archaeon]
MKKTTGTKKVSFVLDGECTPSYNIPDTSIEDLLSRIGAEAVSQVSCGRYGSDTWHKQGPILDSVSYYVLNPDEDKFREYLAGCEELEDFWKTYRPT